MALTMNKKDEMTMRLVHYFITEENYSPIVVNGVKDEIWLQNQEGPYKKSHTKRDLLYFC